MGIEMAGFRIGFKAIADAFFKGEDEEFTRNQYLCRLFLFWVYWGFWLVGCYFVARGHWFSWWLRAALAILLVLTSPTELPFVSYHGSRHRYFNDQECERDTDDGDNL